MSSSPSGNPVSPPMTSCQDDGRSPEDPTSSRSTTSDQTQTRRPGRRARGAWPSGYSSTPFTRHGMRRQRCLAERVQVGHDRAVTRSPEWSAGPVTAEWTPTKHKSVGQGGWQEGPGRAVTLLSNLRRSNNNRTLNRTYCAASTKIKITSF